MHISVGRIFFSRHGSSSVPVFSFYHFLFFLCFPSVGMGTRMQQFRKDPSSPSEPSQALPKYFDMFKECTLFSLCREVWMFSQVDGSPHRPVHTPERASI